MRESLPLPAEEKDGEMTTKESALDVEKENQSSLDKPETRNDFAKYSAWAEKIDALVKVKRKTAYDKQEEKLKEREKEIMALGPAVLEQVLNSGNTNQIYALNSTLELLRLNYGTKRLCDFAQEFIVSHLSQFEEIIRDPQNLKLIPKCLVNVKQAIQFYDSQDENRVSDIKSEGIAMFERVFASLESRMREDEAGEIGQAYSKMFAPLIAGGSPEVAGRALKLVLDFFVSEKQGSQQAADSTISELVNSSSVDEVERYIHEDRSDDSLNSKVKSVLVKIIEGYSLNPEDLVRTWNETSTDRKIGKPYFAFGALYRDNLRNIRYLEQHSPGSAATLRDNFGIKNFGRYPSEVLLDQYKGISDDQTPYGIAIFPYSDHNGAFIDPKESFETLSTSIRGHHLLRVFEAGGKMEIARHLISLDKKYGTFNKISFAFIGGHANPDVIVFGDNKDDLSSRIYSKDLLGKGLQRTSGFFVSRPTIIISGCSTGVKEGIGQKLSKTFSAEVIAPDDKSAVSSITATYKDDRPTFRVGYDNAKAATFESGEKKRTGLGRFLFGK